tara:strand:+ start:1236 stop:2504 length:1269 start_codon:yes stop_codon:yes gene_type:complete
MKKLIFPLLIALAALLVSGSAAFYSVFGLSKLFAGASTQVIIMAGSLEFAKLVVASLLYQYWGTINKWLRSYLSIAVFVLMIITSGGIYGFLSGAYQETATKSELLDKSLSIVNQKQIRFEEQKEDLTIEKTQLNKSISDLRVSLSNPASVSYYDADADQVITTTSSSTRRALQSELESTIKDRDVVNLKLEAILDSINKTDVALLDKEIGNEAERELGPLKYLAETTGYPMGQVVNWFLLLIIFVFDPLAIAMVVAANFAFAQIKRKDPKEIKMSLPEEKKFNEPYPMEEDKWVVETTEKNYPTTEDIIKFNREENRKKALNEPTNDVTEADEKRMDIIGQNGNDGLHYDETDIDIDEEPLEEEHKEIIKREMSVKEKIETKADEQKKRKAPKEGFQGYTINNHAQPIINPNVLKYRNNRK